MNFYRDFLKANEKIFSKALELNYFLICDSTQVSLVFPPTDNTFFPLNGCTNCFRITMDGPSGMGL